MTKKLTGFYAYASNPSDIGLTIESAISHFRNVRNDVLVKSWTSLDIVGHFISQRVLEGIDQADFFVADITVLNFNVTYEIGYAIGKNKRILLTKNKSIKGGDPSITEVGIFDTLGFKDYCNSNELSRLLSDFEKENPLSIDRKINKKAPLYLLETRFKTDWMTRIISRIKKSRYIFRSFDPTEQPRLSAGEAISNVSESIGVIVPLVSNKYEFSNVHNMRGAFIAGLADGMNKVLLLLQHGEDPVPLDYRDFVKVCVHPDDINDYIADFAAQVAEVFQQDDAFSVKMGENFLQALELGSSSAENEMRTLENYYLKTDQFLKSVRGEAHLVVGRKGSGKSAIFLQVRDRERSRGRNIVLDLKPDGYKLVKFKEQILRFLQEGTFQHTIMAFWEYVLLLEICYKILEKDKDVHIHDNKLYAPYRKLAELYHAEIYETEGDFSERMTMLMDRVSADYQSKYGDETNIRLSSPQVTELLHCRDIRELSSQVKEYMKHKETLWLLFDNIDKGWPTSGLKNEDLIIIRALLDATRKIERQFNGQNINVNTIVFLRNDVYELLVSKTADRGKEANVLLDWTDSDLLRELVRLRIVSNESFSKSLSFEQVWSRVCVSHYNGEDSSQYLIDRSLMRPRFLLNLINQCKSYAINLNHQTIQAEDINKGLGAYSTDLLTDIGYELRDVSPEMEDVLYAFIGSKSVLHESEIKNLLKDFFKKEDIQSSIDLLLWYGFLGVRISDAETKYIYNLNYNMQLLKGFIRKMNSHLSFSINPAFWHALMID